MSPRPPWWVHRPKRYLVQKAAKSTGDCLYQLIEFREMEPGNSLQQFSTSNNPKKCRKESRAKSSTQYKIRRQIDLTLAQTKLSLYILHDSDIRIQCIPRHGCRHRKNNRKIHKKRQSHSRQRPPGNRNTRIL
jgi:hypothetical protein